VINIISYNMMSLENRVVTTESLKALLRFSKDEILLIALQEAKCEDSESVIQNIVTDTLPKAVVETHIHSGKVLHKANLATISSNIRLIRAIKIDLPRLTSLVWKLLFRLVGSDVPQHSALITVYELPEKEELTVVNVHLDAFGGSALKFKQMELIKSRLEKQESSNVVILGDFNTSGSLTLKRLGSIFGSGLKLVGNPGENTVGIKNTMSSAIPGSRWIHQLLNRFGLTNLFNNRTDWMLVKNLSIQSDGVLSEHEGSDHYPIWVKINIS